MSSVSQVVPHGAVKFRENSADSVTFNAAGHTAALPHTITFSRVLPLPRKGNPGTLKIYINERKSYLVDVGLETERVVLGIVKTETSMPVGISEDEIRDFVRESAEPLCLGADGNGDTTTTGRNESLICLFAQGLLPDVHGDPTA